VYVSSHPLQKMTVDLMNVITHSTVEITEELVNRPVVIAGMITDVRQITTKKGDTMAFVRLEDLQGNVDITVFPQLYRDRRGLWAPDKIVIVQGKVDVRNGRVSVLADAVRDYVEGMTVIEDTTSVAYRYRNGGLPAWPSVPDSRSAIRERPAAPYMVPEAEEGYVYPADENPFAMEEPEWLDQGARGRVSGATTVGADGARLEAVPPEAARPHASPVAAPPPVAATAPQTPAVAAPATAGSPRTIRLTFRRSPSLEGDRRRLGELVELLSEYDGEDRFEIVVEAAVGPRYQLAFPNNRTRICKELQRELTMRLGASGWKVEE